MCLSHIEDLKALHDYLNSDAGKTKGIITFYFASYLAYAQDREFMVNGHRVKHLRMLDTKTQLR
jgi:hypothetical protein